MNLSLLRKTALVNGSTQGIGLACAIALSKLGANCILVARNAEALTDALRLLDKSQNQQHRYLVADFDDPEQVRKTTIQIAGGAPVHILVNNSGGPSGGLLLDATADEFLLAFNRHLICNHHMARAFVPLMAEAGYGRIINIISTSVKVPLPNLGVSNTIRGAVASWAKTLSNEVAGKKITVNNVLPGATKTQRLQQIIEANAAKKHKAVKEIEQSMIKEIPAGRFAEPEEIANLVAFLASPAAAYITGTSIPVDGGRTGAI